MKKVLFGGGVLAIAAVLFAFTRPSVAETSTQAEEATAITWLSWEEATEAMAEEPRMMFIDVYTEWCGWCKRMDANTFTDPAVIEYMNDNFYAVKFDAEGREDADFKGRTLVYRADVGRRGVHELAYVLLNGRLGYPSFVYLDQEQNSVKVSPGYKTPDVLLSEMQSIVSGQ